MSRGTSGISYEGYAGRSFRRDFSSYEERSSSHRLARERPVTPDTSLPSEQAILLAPRVGEPPLDESPLFSNLSTPTRPRVDAITGSSSVGTSTPKAPGRKARISPESPARSNSRGRNSPGRPLDPYSSSLFQQEVRPTTPSRPRLSASNLNHHQDHNQYVDGGLPQQDGFDPYNSALYRAALQSVHSSQLNRERSPRGAPNSTFHHYDNNQHALRQPQKPALKRSSSGKSTWSEPLGSAPAWMRDSPGNSRTSTPTKRRNPNEKANQQYSPYYSSTHSDPGGNLPWGEEQSVHAASWAPDNQFTLPLDAIVVLKGGVIETHSSHMLAYASPVLAQHLTPISHGRHRGKHRVEIPNGDVRDWTILKPFLQPHSVQKASVTTQNLTILLPWFHELKLMILLNECDALLSTLTFADPRTSHPSNQDWHDLLILSQICCRVDLPLTLKSSMNTLQGYLAKYPSFCSKEPSLQTLMSLLRDSPNARKFLWKTVTTYLPVDLLMDHKSETDISETLVMNPLFPYLWREGLNKQAAKEEERAQHDLEKERLRRWRQRRKALENAGEELEEMARYNSIISEESDWKEPSWMQADPEYPLFSDNKEGEEKETSRLADDDASELVQQKLNEDPFITATASSKKALEEFAEWWYSWSQGSREVDDDDDSGVLDPLHSGEIPPERTVWLEAILARVKRLPLFFTLPPVGGEDEIMNGKGDDKKKTSTPKVISAGRRSPPKSRSSARISPARARGDERTFSC